MKQNYVLYEAINDIAVGKDKHGKEIKEIVTEANHEPNGRLLSPEVLISNMVTGEGRRFLSLSDASRYLHKSHNYLSVMFSTAKKNAGGKLVQSLMLGDNYVTRVDWVRRNEMVPTKAVVRTVYGKGFTMRSKP